MCDGDCVHLFSLSLISSLSLVTGFIVPKMEYNLSDGVLVEEIESKALERYKANLHVHEDGYVRFMPSGQVSLVQSMRAKHKKRRSY